MPPLAPMHITHKQEAFSAAYIRAVCAVAGCSVAVPETDNDKVDFTVSSRVSGSLRTKPKLDIQSKCHLSPALGSETTISYSLDIETYDSLRDEMVSDPRILVLLIAPTLESDWLTQTEELLAMKNCAYWLSLKGLPAVDGQQSKTVHLPRTNIFCPQALSSMMTNISNTGELS